MNHNGGNQEFQYHNSTPPALLKTEQDSKKDEPAPLVEWKASEFIDHQKNASWFLPLIGGAIVICVGIYFITRDILATLVLLFGGVAFGLYARQKPRTLTYGLGDSSITVDKRTYSYDEFRTFSIIQEGALYSIYLQPIKRFMPPLSIYFPPEEGEKIFDTLASHLPHQERTQDPIERLMRKIRF